MYRHYAVIFVLIATFILSVLLTYMVRNYALKKSILDIPNERSSHTVVTPRGGGLAFVAVILVGILVGLYVESIDSSIAVAMLGGGLIVAVIGWWDDKEGLSSRVRSVFQFLAAVWALYWLGGFTSLDLGFMTIHLGWIGNVIAAIGIVWIINLYNFMDGIDGIAGTEAVSVLVVVGILIYLSGDSELALLCCFLACSVAGFLVWNWPPAKIFMGDVGSSFLGFVFACLAIASENTGAIPFIIWILLLGVFVIDATATLILRVSQGNKWYEAHRSHVYQLAVQAGYAHRQVTLIVLTINSVLALIAYWVFIFPHLLLAVSLVIAVLLIVIHTYLRKHFMRRIEGLTKLSEFQAGIAGLEVASMKDNE